MRVETGYEVETSLKEDSEALWMGSPHQAELVVNTKDKCEMELVGGKALNISRLAREGFTVPEGFCITTEAYDYFMRYNSISAEDEDIAEKIRNGVMPQRLVDAICATYYTYLSGNSCAVRSSSPLEDLKSASFAGQYTSVLNVTSENALLNAVRECWASLWSRPVVEYRKKMGIENEHARMAVLVQEMVPATASGVLFTEDQIIIEAVWGLGESLVSGKVIPDHFVVDRDRFTIRERTISHKEVMSQVNSTGGIKGVAVPEHKQDTPVLKDDHIRKLCALGEQVEELFGCPQDIEWAVCNGEVVVLQARPISVKQTQTIWSRANAVENQPSYVTYLSRLPENRPDDIVLGLLLLLKRFGINELPENIKIRGYIYGHVYLNVTTTREVLGMIPGISSDVVDRSLGHTKEKEGTSEETVKESKPKLSETVKLLPGVLRVIWFFLQLPEQAGKVIPHSVELIEDIRHRDLSTMTLEELDNLAWEMYDRNSQVTQVHAVTTTAAMSLFSFLQKMVARYGEEGTENLLTTGLEGMSSCQLGIEMWKLAESASRSPRISALIHSREDVVEDLNQFSQGRAFLEDLNTFVDRFGDRCSEEMEISIPRWGENPRFVLSMVANYLNSSVNPVEIMEEQKKMRLEATDHILRTLSKNPVEKLFFEKILEKTQQYIVTRENLKTTWMRGISAMRVIYLAIADNLVNRGILPERDDIFYLKVTEVSDVIAGTLEKEQIVDILEERRKEKEEYEHLDVPEVIVGEPPPIEELIYTVEPETQFEGTGCSCGVITGKARVVMNPAECPELKEGEILVAPYTDPGWSPLFVTAGGLVTEIGGTLSHGVIIAREYGIPAVVGVKNATKIIKTGQLVTVDGNRGMVYIRE